MDIDKKAGLGVLASATAMVVGGQSALAQEIDWTGHYAGISANGNFGQMPWEDPDDYTLVSTPVLGGFVGMRWSGPGDIVMGAELSVQSRIGGDADGNGDSEDYAFSMLTDTKLSVGKPFGNALVYAFGGVSGTKMVASSDDRGYSAFGANLGIGVDYMMSDSFSVGAEYTHRFMSGYEDRDQYDVSGAKASTVSLRAAFRF
jgi:outer membrane immunogenic protein